MSAKVIEIKNEIPITGLATTTAINEKVIEIELPYITNVATKGALNMEATEIENKIPNNHHQFNENKF